MKNLRLRNTKDIAPAKIEGQSFVEYLKSNNGGEQIAYGYIGIDGKKPISSRRLILISMAKM